MIEFEIEFSGYEHEDVCVFMFESGIIIDCVWFNVELIEFSDVVDCDG